MPIEEPVSYRDAGQCFALQGGGEGPRGEGRQGPSCALTRLVLLLDVLTQDTQRCPVYRAREIRTRPEPVGRVVVAREVGKLLPHPPAGHSLEGVDQLRQGDLGWAVQSGWTWLFSPLNSTSSVSKSAHTAGMISSMRAGCRSVNIVCRNFVTKTK